MPVEILFRLFRNVHHPRFWRQQLAVAWDQQPDRRTRTGPAGPFRARFGPMHRSKQL